MSEFLGKVVLIAGALGTVGVGVAEQFRQKGATVRIVEDEIGNPVDFARLCDSVAAEHGRLDLVIQCHGKSDGGSVVPPRAEALPAGDPLSWTPALLRHWREKLGALFVGERRWMTG
jgi:NAD(P)-dependent dehydrogenase (short-subunit alcohol dehydrogenase family)